MRLLLLNILFLLWFVPISALAISLEELQNNTDSYVKILEGKPGTVYVDVNSIHSLRYAPPYYTLSGTMYEVDYNGNMICKTDLSINYDYGSRFSPTLAQNFLIHNQNLSTSSFIAKLFAAVDEYSGLSAGVISEDFWNLDGSYIGHLDSSPIDKIYAGSPIYFTANYFFYKYYNEYFNPQLGNDFF